MSVTLKVVHGVSMHTSPTKEMVSVKKQKQQVVVRCVGDRKEPSAEALERFIEVYARMVKENEKEVNRHAKTPQRV